MYLYSYRYAILTNDRLPSFWQLNNAALLEALSFVSKKLALKMYFSK